MWSKHIIRESSYCHLHPFFEVESSFVYEMMKITIWIYLRMLTSTSELRNELVDIENYIYFENIKWMWKTSNVLWSGGKNINPCFQLLVNYASIYKCDTYNDSLFTQCIMQNFGNEGMQVQNA